MATMVPVLLHFYGVSLPRPIGLPAPLPFTGAFLFQKQVAECISPGTAASILLKFVQKMLDGAEDKGVDPFDYSFSLFC
jgi:hypothetical protein